MKIKNLDYQIIYELVKNAKVSDRALAKKLGVSQPTITRRRAKLESEGKLDYGLIPQLVQLDFEIMAFTFLSWKRRAFPVPSKREYSPEEFQRFLKRNPEIIFASTGQGLEMTRVTISIHRNYSDYASFRRRLKTEWNEYIQNLRVFTISLKSDEIMRHLTFEYLMKSFADSPT